MSHEAWRRDLGAVTAGPGWVSFRVWAPAASAVSVRLERGLVPLVEAGDGVFEAVAEAAAGDRYRFVLDGGPELADPCSRFQPLGLDGPSEVVDPSSFRWSDERWRGVPLDELLVYELHVGAFTPEGTFDAVAPRLAGLRALGVTAIELMPVATFPGNRNWGYDGVYLSAPHPAYGGPDGLARLVDAAHREGIAVILDIVCNHVGPGGEAFRAFGPYFAEHPTTWGPAPAFEGPAAGPVREWVIQSACQWVRDYHVDGFRIDAAHEIRDRSAPHVVAELDRRVHAVSDRRVLVTIEGDPTDQRMTSPPEAWGADAWWADGFHHALHAALTGETDGYYEGFGSISSLAHEFNRSTDPRLVVFAQNHDQVGNRAAGDRLPAHLQRLAAFCVLLSPFIPLLFMGEEYGERAPFQFFTDHPDPAAEQDARTGRQKEFASFHGFAGSLPDPQSPETFARSCLRPEEADPELRGFYAELVSLRRTLPSGAATASCDDEHRWLRVQRGAYELVCNFSAKSVRVPTACQELVFATATADLAPGEVVLQAWSGTLLR